MRAAAGAPVVLLVAGDGPQAAEVRARAGDGVRALGQRDDVPALLAAADVLVMPSEREGLSFAVLEAMGAGLALVVSDGAGNPEAVGDAGIVVAVGDIDGLAAALATLATDHAQVQRLGAAARRRVLTELTAESLRAASRRPTPRRSRSPRRAIERRSAPRLSARMAGDRATAYARALASA